MLRPFGFRTLLAISSALAVLLAALAVVQYRWSTRVAAADVQREREHLDTAASLFTNRFNDNIGKIIDFIMSEAEPAMKAGRPLPAPPKLVGELYYIDLPARGVAQAERLTAQATLVPTAVPEWAQPTRCAMVVLDQPPAVVVPTFHVEIVDKTPAATLRIVRGFSGGHCFVAQLNERYLREELFPRLISDSFGEKSADEYDFAVVERARPGRALYGAPANADLEKPFFAMMLRKPALPVPLKKAHETWQDTMFVQRFEYNIVSGVRPAGFEFRDGVWELQVTHKGVPLNAAFEKTQRRNLLFSLAVEALLVVAILFLVVAVRRMQQLAEQKMQFVAAVSHELRAPVSAISMLSRNQADGLVTGGEKVRQYGELMHQQSRRLNEMVERTLQYAGIHSNLGRPAKTEIDLKRLIDEAVDARREQLARLGFDIEVDVDAHLPTIYGDANLLRIAIDNLLSNAEKYAEGGRWIGVSASYSAAAKEVLIRVEDRGPGIASGEQSGIFEPFFRGHAAVDAQIPGSGIGLSLVRSAAEAHRGSVTLVSEPGRGSAFTLHLPV